MKSYTVWHDELNTLGIFGGIAALFGALTGIVASFVFGVYWDWMTMEPDAKEVLTGVVGLVKILCFVAGGVFLVLTVLFGVLMRGKIKKIKDEHDFLEVSGD